MGSNFNLKPEEKCQTSFDVEKLYWTNNSVTNSSNANKPFQCKDRPGKASVKRLRPQNQTVESTIECASQWYASLHFQGFLHRLEKCLHCFNGKGKRGFNLLLKYMDIIRYITLIRVFIIITRSRTPSLIVLLIVADYFIGQIKDTENNSVNFFTVTELNMPS